MRALLFVIATIAALNTSPASAVQKDVIERASLAFTEQLELSCTPGAEPEWIAEDAVYKYALSSLYVWLRVEGREAVAAHLCGLSAVAPAAEVENIQYIPTPDREVVFVHYDLVPTDGSGERKSPLAMIEMRGNQIVNFTQLSRSPQSLNVLQAATGGMN
jgi:hypothetical protein